MPTAIAIDAPAIMRLMDCANPALAARYVEPIKEAMLRAEINTPLRVAHLMAQIGHECGGLRWLEELADGKAYEGRVDLGNTSPGDGQAYKGHGIIQVTGRTNHHDFGVWLGVGDLFLRAPRLIVSDPRYSALTAAWYWSTRGLNRLVDTDDGSTVRVTIKGGSEPREIAVNRSLYKLTLRINGGTNGIEDRQRRFANNKRFLEIK